MAQQRELTCESEKKKQRERGSKLEMEGENVRQSGRERSSSE